MTKQSDQQFRRLLRIYRLCCLAVGILLLVPALALAQVSDDQIPPSLSIPPSPDVATEQKSLAAAPSPSVRVRGPCDPDYWIVSSRNARCEIENGQACPYEVLRYDGANPARWSSLEELVGSLQPNVPVCIMAHGSFVTWDSMINDSANTYRWLRAAAPCQPLQIIFYTWASTDGQLIPHLRVNQYGDRSSLNGLYIADLVSKIPCDHPVCLMGHSHGARMMVSSLHAMAGGAIEDKVLARGPLPQRRLRVVLAAAAIDHNWMNPTERYGLALCPPEGVLNLRNHSDFPLLFFPLRKVFGRQALAISGVTRRDRSEMCDWGNKIVDYDVSDLVGLGHLWSFYYRQPAIASAIRHYVYFDEPNAVSAAASLDTATK